MGLHWIESDSIGSDPIERDKIINFLQSDMIGPDVIRYNSE